MLANNNVTTYDDIVAKSGRLKNRTCDIPSMYFSITLYSTHYPILQIKDNVLIIGTNVAWTQRQKSVVNRIRLWVHSERCSVNIDWFRILSEFVRLLKELRIGEEEEIYTIPSKFILHCEWLCLDYMLLITNYLMLRLLSSVNPENKVTRYTLSWEKPLCSNLR